MAYTILELSNMAGVTTRTLRYYDQIGLICPRRQDSSGYRVYSEADADRLQQVLFYRELGVQLSDIKRILLSEGFDNLAALRDHRQQLVKRRNRMNRLIDNVDRTIAAAEGSTTMHTDEKFEGFKRELIEENERTYGAEIRGTYGDETVDASNRKMMNMTEENYDAMQKLGEDVLEALRVAFVTGDPAGELAQHAVELHKQWLTFSWPSYSPEAHAGLAQMYVDDARFTAYYDGPIGPGAAAFLRDAVHIYTGKV